MFKKYCSKSLMLFITVLTLFFAINTVSFAEGHWADNEIQYLLEKQIVSGYADGSFKPDKDITRAEFIKIINNVLGLTEKAEVHFKDVNSDAWFYDEVAKALKVGYIDGYEDNTLRPSQAITREEVAKILVVSFDLEENGSGKHTSFNDNDHISNWAREYVSILHNSRYISGYPNNTFRPEKPITRAEAVKMTTNISGNIVNDSKDVSNNVTGNLLVSVANTYLKDIHISGDLYLVEGIGDGKVTLDNVTVDGNIYIRSGEIIIKSSKVNRITTSRAYKDINVSLYNTEVPLIRLNTDTKLVVKEGASIKNLEVGAKSNIEIEKNAKVEKVEISTKNVELKVDGDIDSIVSHESFKLNGETIKKGKDLSIKDGKVVEPEDKKGTPEKPSKPMPEKPKGDEDPKEEPKDKYVFTANLDKDKYKIDEDIKVSGKVLKNDQGLDKIDITLKLVDSEGVEIITVDQIKTDAKGEFTYKFKAPEGTEAGEYKIILKANEPVNMFAEKNLKLSHL